MLEKNKTYRPVKRDLGKNPCKNATTDTLKRGIYTERP